MEIWSDIDALDGWYQVSTKGRIKSVPHYVSVGGGKYRQTKEKILKTYLAGNDIGYHYIKLHKNGETFTYEIHRLVAETFIPNPENKPQVDHINGDKNNNSVENLRWATQSENLNNPITRSQRLNNHKTSKQVYQYTLDGELVNIYQSMHDAERAGFGRKEIKKCCFGLLQKHKGYKWSFEPL